MNVELKRIAEKKLEQLGGDVCGVLVRKGDKLAAVDEHGRVRWLQDGQGAEPVAFIEDSELEALREGMNIVYVRREDDRPDCTPLYTHPQPAQQDPDIQIIQERDYWEEKATELAEDVGKLLGVELGEHSSANCPVQNAIDAVFRATEYPAQQGSVPEGYVLVEKGITPTPVVEAGLECFRLLNQSGIADDRTVVLSVFQDMLLAAERLAPATPRPEGDGWVKCSERLPTHSDPVQAITNDYPALGVAVVPARYVDGNGWTDIDNTDLGGDESPLSEVVAWREMCEIPTGLKCPQPPKQEGYGDE